MSQPVYLGCKPKLRSLDLLDAPVDPPGTKSARVIS